MSELKAKRDLFLSLGMYASAAALTRKINQMKEA